MFCEECGNELSENVKFCPKCGHGIGIQADSVPQVSGTDKDIKSIESVKEAAPDKRGGMVLSIIFSILIVLAGIWCSVIFLVRHVFSEGVIDNVVKAADLSQIEVGFLTDDSEDMTLAEYISDYAASIFPIPWSEEDVEALLDEKFIRNFAADKVNDYVRDLFYETEEGVIKVSELEHLVERNEKAIYKITGVHLTEDDLTYMVEILKQEKILDNTALSVYRESDSGTFSLIKNMLSYWMLILLLILVVLLIFGIFFVQGKKLKGFCYLGISLTVTGAVNLITSIFIVGSLAEKMNRNIELGRKFWRLLFTPIQKMSISLGIFLIVPGVICGVIYVITMLYGKRAGKPEKMRASGK